MLEAVLLVGGHGTRLRPLTITTPKPMLRVANATVTEHQIARAAAAGVSRIILGTSYKAEVFSAALGTGSSLGVELAYAVEDQPMGTGGAIRNASEHLGSGPDDPVLVFNGDVLTGVDIGALLDAWQTSGADVALYLTRVSDPRPYGLVPTTATGDVIAFLEKPERDEDIVTDQINAGLYVFRRSIIDEIAVGRPVSVERETFPGLLNRGAKVIGVVDESYWIDLGNPLAFVTGSRDLVTGTAPSPLVTNPGTALIDPSAQIHPDAVVGGGSAIGPNAIVEAGAVVDGSVLFAGATVRSQARVVHSVIGERAVVGAATSLDGVAVGDAATIGAGVELTRGARVWPNTVLPDGAVRYSSDV